jgi:hypothetical protein
VAATNCNCRGYRSALAEDAPLATQHKTLSQSSHDLTVRGEFMSREAARNTIQGNTMTDETKLPTKWAKGMPSPNPKGRPKQPKNVVEVRQLAREHTTGAIETLVRVHTNPKAPPAARVTKKETLVRRGKKWFRYDAPDKRLFKQLQKTLVTGGSSSEHK